MSDQSDVKKTVEIKPKPINWLAYVFLLAGLAWGFCIGSGIRRASDRKQAIKNNAAHYELVCPSEPTVRFCWGPAPVVTDAKEVNE